MSLAEKTGEKGLIAWFAGNHVAANLLMVLILAFGVISTLTIRKQTTPDFELRNIQVRVPYLGAAPQEVEEGVVIKIEEAIQEIDGIVKVNSDSQEGLGTVTIEVATGEDINEVLNEVKTRVDAISTFPGLTEKPVIYKQDVPIHVVFVALHGNMDEYARKSLAQQIRDELTLLPSVNQVQFLGDRDYEISVEVSEQTLRRYGLTMSEVSEAIRASSVDLPGGSIKTVGGDILLRTEGQVYTGLEFADIVLRTDPDGTRLTVGDIATIDDGFVETDGFGRFDGRPTAMMRVLAVGEQNELATARDVKAYIEQRRARLPEGINLDVWVDRSHYLKGRLDMMVKNMLQGALLVFIVLSLFLRLKFAMWVIIGIPIAFFGAMWLMPHGPWPVTINMISLFGFILVLGIVVDDAIIIGESVYTSIRKDGHTLDNVIRGARQVAVPATFGVLTTMAAFAPMLFVGGIPGPFFESMSVVVMLCLFFSLVESKLILPAHLAHSTIRDIDEKAIFRPYSEMEWRERPARFFQRLNRHTQHGLHRFVATRYRPMLEAAVRNRGMTVALFSALLILTVGVMNSGLARLVLFPDVPSDFVQVQLSMQDGSSPQSRNDALDRLERAALEINADWVTEHPGDVPPMDHIGAFTNGDTGGILFAEMPKDDDRPLDGDDIEIMWRERAGEIPGVKELTFSGGNNIGGGAPLSFNLTGNNYDTLEGAAGELERKLREYSGVFDIRNSLSSGGEEIRLRIKPEAEALGLSMTALGRQVRQAFYGEEAQRIQRGRDELKVMVRYPREERRSVADLENMRIRTPAGDEVPFTAVAEVSYGKSYSSIKRQDRKRVVTVSADVDPDAVEPSEIVKEISEEFMPELLARYPGVGYALEGSSLEETKLIRNLRVASIAALFLIYGLIAIPLRSYGQPLVIMSVIPFGLIALAGVVVNDSIIMVDFINRARAEGADLIEAVVQSGTQRFRAIILTSLTTAAGLMPIMLEKSLQAQFVIPMAISLSFGIVFATIITLFLVPALFVLQLDAMAVLRRLRNFVMGRDDAGKSAGTVSA